MPGKRQPTDLIVANGRKHLSRAEKAAAEKAAAEKRAQFIWDLSEREKEIVAQLGKR